jgi:hypothetical protein
VFRKLTHSVFALFLLVSTTGITISMHYCGGKLVTTSIYKEAKSCCDGSKGCCENKTFRYEIKNDYLNPINFENIKVETMDIKFSELSVFNTILFPEVKKTHKVFTDSSPPSSTHTRLSLLQTYLC